MSGWIDDPISSHIENEYLKIEQRVSYNMAQGDWDRAERWAQYLWAFRALTDDVCWQREDA
jgi:hypothetical protein